MAKHNETGKIGENIAVNFIIKKGFDVICRNYSKKWGEIDIVAEKDKVIHFVEVKTVSRRSFGDHFEQEINNYRPEDNMHPWKLKRLQRALQTYLLEKYPPSRKASAGQSKNSEPEWQFDLICVFLDQEKRVAKVKFIENLIL
jgi:putative endonuclease